MAELSRSVPPAGDAGQRGQDALRGDRGPRFFRQCGRFHRPKPYLHRDGRQYHDRGPVRAVIRPARRAGADRPAQGGARIFARRGAREAVDRHQRRSCELPAGGSGYRQSRRMEDGDPRLRPGLSDGRGQLSRPYRDAPARGRARPAYPPYLRGRGDAHSVRGGQLQRRVRRQSGVRARGVPHRLFVDGDAGHRVRLSPGERRAGGAENPGNPVRL